MAEALHTFSIIAYVIAEMFILAALILCIVFKIPNIIGELSGKSAKKAIQMARQNNEKSLYGLSKINSSGTKVGTITETMKITKCIPGDEGTRVLKDNLADVYQGQETVMLMENPMEIHNNSGYTAPLEATTSKNENRPKVLLQMLDMCMLVHTDEEIK